MNKLCLIDDFYYYIENIKLNLKKTFIIIK